MPNTKPIFSDAPGGAQSNELRRNELRHRNFRLPLLSVLGAAVIIVAALLLVTAARRPASAGFIIKNAALGSVERRTIRDIVSVSGVLELSRKEIIASPGAGVVEAVLADEGSVVEPGQILLRIGTEDLDLELESKRLSLEKVLRQAEQADAERAFAKRRYDIDIASARRALDDARRSYDAAAALQAKNLASAEELLSALRTLRSAEEALEQASIKQEEAEVLYLMNVKNYKTDRTILESEIAELAAKIASYTVSSVRGGTVYSLGAETGGTVSAYQELAVVAYPQDARVALDVPETRISAVAKGMPVTVYLGSASYPAVVETVAPAATSSSSSSGSVVRVTASFAEKPERPTIGGSVSAEIVAGTIENALVLPRGPYLSSGNYASAYAVAGSTASKRAVKFGIADGAYIQILSGLSEGESVVLSDYRDFIHLDSVALEAGRR